MCLSVNRPTLTNQVNVKSNTTQTKEVQKPLNLDLPKDFDINFKTQDSMSMTDMPQAKRMIYPNIPIYQEPNDDSLIRLKEFSPNSAKIEFGNPNEKPLLTVKVRNEEIYDNFNSRDNIHTNSKVSFDSPYLKDQARTYAKEAVMGNVVEPLRGAIGKTAADTTLGVAVVATALVSAKHLPDGHFKVDLPSKKLTGDDTLKTKLILGYGDGENLKVTGGEVSKRFEYGDSNIDIKARYRTDSKVSDFRGTEFKGTEKIELEAVIMDKNPKWDSGVLSARIGHDDVSGTSAGIFFNKKF